MSYVSSLYHVVFSTKGRRPVIVDQYSDNLYKVIAAEINATKSKALIINGVQDHIHILLSLNPSISLSALVRDLKSKSTVWIKGTGYFPLFVGWEKEYAAFSASAVHKDAIYKYIAEQREHHKTASLENEYERLILKAGLRFYKPNM